VTAAGEHHAAQGRAPLQRDEAARLMRSMLSGELEAADIRQFLVDYNLRQASPDELSGFLDAVRMAATPIELDADIASRSIDIVGTGGDKSGSVNVSTMAALVVAGAGVPVCKHGNRSASSKCGTADVLEALGATIELSADRVARCVERTSFGFVFAPTFHPAFKHVGPIRRELGVPTIFNLLGPMANPAPVAAMLVGVADPSRMSTMVEVLAARTQRAWVVHGHGGLDELSLSGPNRVLEAKNGGTHDEVTIDASELGFGRATNDELRGGDPAHNASVVRAVLNDELRGPIRDVVVLNAAAALVVAGAVNELAAGASMAIASITGGAARAALEAFIAETTLKS